MPALNLGGAFRLTREWFQAPVCTANPRVLEHFKGLDSEYGALGDRFAQDARGQASVLARVASNRHSRFQLTEEPDRRSAAVWYGKNRLKAGPLSRVCR